MDCLLECSLINSYAGCGRSTLVLLSVFGLVWSVQPPKLNSKCTQMNYEMNYEMNCITIHKCTAMYSSVLQMAQVHLQVPVLFFLFCSYLYPLTSLFCQERPMPCAFFMQALTGKSSGKCTGIMQHFALLVLMLLLSSLAHTTYS